MKNYDDLQRFKEKTQTLDIAFKDMSGQSHEADQSQWALIRQLAHDDQPELGSGQRIDLPQPQPIRGDEFAAPAPVAQAPLVSSGRSSLLESVSASLPAAESAAPPSSAASLFPPAATEKAAPAVTPLMPKATHVERQATTSLFPPPPPKAADASIAPAPQSAVPAAAPAAPFAAAVEPARQVDAAPSRFGSLFRSRPAEPVNLSKETRLKPLLEKIALCR